MMTLRVLAGPGDGCSGGNCPTVYVEDESPETVIVQGYELDADSVSRLGSLPHGENALRVPRALIVEAYDALQAEGTD